MTKDPYKILGVNRDAEIEVIKAAYHALAKKYHPDKNSSPNANVMMKEINEAFEQIRKEREDITENSFAKQRESKKQIINIKEIAILKSRSPVTSVAFNNEGSIIASGHRETSVKFSVKFWSISTKQPFYETQQGKEDIADPINSFVAFNNCGSLLALGSNAGEYIHIISPLTGGNIKKFKINKGYWANTYCLSLSFHPHQDILAIGSSDKYLRLFDISSDKPPVKLSGHTREIWSVAFSSDGSKLISGSADKTIGVWDIKSGQSRFLLGHSDRVRSVAYSPDGNYFASGSDDSTIRIWATSYGREIRALLGHKNGVRSVAFSPDGSIIASGSADKTVKFWSVDNGKNIFTGCAHTKSINAVAFSPNGKLLVSGSNDGTIRLWQIE